MRPLTVVEVRAVLHASFDGQTCVQAWLGYADVLFLGVGRGAPIVPMLDGSHPMPPYELQTHRATWSLGGPEGYVSQGAPREVAAAAVRCLEGLTLTGWQLNDDTATLGLRIAHDHWISVVPHNEPGESDVEAWCVRQPDGSFLSVRCNGTMGLADPDEVSS